METARFIEFLDREGRLLASAADAAGSDAEVPHCPGWRVRDLVGHTGVVHRWAASFVAQGQTSPRPMGDPPDLDGTALTDWYRANHRRLVDTLTAAPPDVRCWQFLPAPTPLVFWARRQAHETAVHRFDAESAAGGVPSALDAEFAADGIDELLGGMHGRAKSRVRSEKPRVLRVRATDVADAVWTVRVTQEPPVTERGDTGDAECEITGPAGRLYLALWNRQPFPQVTGDASLAELWRRTSGVG
ncbi:maleylpyruvate isomerase family mycothiol-dependent enzyme [Streptomyces sp. ISL-12]|uniref:maleylpyruvate isomerase family mycothiol-dependent enzyme n=1 Tax=Streptomyces sp. ISL-12 TaxID=2819177 RepID=UPI001BE6F620|nr:maleylpyruvate isomerase family mycothiol-dependent enzyme [Streptomyces sp. ISL-12]MBT2409685.1 maleylpyruvate isomerase family mycothiol-dependent enzyme [Streptomyces sp. ISL-12]